MFPSHVATSNKESHVVRRKDARGMFLLNARSKLNSKFVISS